MPDPVQPGFYWVKTRYGWVIAEWGTNYTYQISWWFPGNELPYSTQAGGITAWEGPITRS